MAILSGQTTPFTSFLPQPNKLILMLVFTLAPILLSSMKQHNIYTLLGWVGRGLASLSL